MLKNITRFLFLAVLAVCLSVGTAWGALGLSVNTNNVRLYNAAGVVINDPASGTLARYNIVSTPVTNPDIIRFYFSDGALGHEVRSIEFFATYRAPGLNLFGFWGSDADIFLVNNQSTNDYNYTGGFSGGSTVPIPIRFWSNVDLSLKSGNLQANAQTTVGSVTEHPTKDTLVQAQRIQINQAVSTGGSQENNGLIMLKGSRYDLPALEKVLPPITRRL